MQTNKALFVVVLALSSSLGVLANTKKDPHVPIGHCYHWLNEGSQKHLSYKHNFARNHDGEMTFYTDPATSNGAIAGPGLYCGKTPGDSYSYGDRVIRVDFVEDVVMLDETTGRQYCGHRGDFYQNSSECQGKPWDIKFYSGGGVGSYAWYVIRNPQAVAGWSATSDQLIADLNAEKAYENSSYSIHADQTISRMSSDPRGKIVTINNNARMSIMKIVNDADKLAQVPPLTVIALLHNYRGDDLSNAKRKGLYNSQFARAFLDTKLSFTDILSTIKLSTEIETAFLGELRKVSAGSLDKVNPVLVMQGLDRYEDHKNLSADRVRALWRASILSSNDLQSLVDNDLTDKGAFASGLEVSLPTSDEVKSKLADYNLVPFLKILNKYVVNGTGSQVKLIFKVLLSEVIQKRGMDFAPVYDKIDNAVLAKDTVLGSIVNDLMAPGVIKNSDPLVLGLAVDRIAASMDEDTLKATQDKLVKLPLLVTSAPTYQVMDDYEDQKLKLPSFFEEQDFLLKIIRRSLAEKKVSKTPTNTFRMVTTGFFTHFNAKVRKAKDDKAKDAASLKSSTELLNLAYGMNSPELLPYRYITVQNASLFLGKGRARDHAMEHILATYKTGDAGLDTFLEDVVKTSYDGSLVQYLIFNSKKAEIASLLKMTVDHLMSAAFSAELADANFISSQSEKQSWNNIVSNKNYSPSENSRAPSNICHVANVVKKYNQELGRALSKTDASDMGDWAKNIESGFCKKK